MIETLKEAVNRLHEERPRLKRSYIAVARVLNGERYQAGVTQETVPRPIAAKEGMFVAIASKYVNIADLAHLPTDEAKEDALTAAMMAARSPETDQEILFDATQIKTLREQYERAGSSISKPTFGQPSEVIKTPIFKTWIEEHNGGVEITADDVAGVAS